MKKLPLILIVIGIISFLTGYFLTQNNYGCSVNHIFGAFNKGVYCHSFVPYIYNIFGIVLVLIGGILFSKNNATKSSKILKYMLWVFLVLIILNFGLTYIKYINYMPAM